MMVTYLMEHLIKEKLKHVALLVLTRITARNLKTQDPWEPGPRLQQMLREDSYLSG